MTTINKKMDIDRVSDKKVSDAIKAFKELGRDDVNEDRCLEELKSLYGAFEEPEKRDLFRSIIDEVEISTEAVSQVFKAWTECERGDSDWGKCLSELRHHLFSPRLHIFRKISRLPGGLKFLLDFRGDLLSLQRLTKIDLRPLDSDIVLLFELWFQEGFLYLEEINLESSYRQIELIKNSDLVHPMSSIEDMGQRLGKDRRCFALYHRLIPYEPVVFIEVALTGGIVQKITEILQSDMGLEKEGMIDTAIFYSINNTQNGLAGLGLGKMLIGRVVEYLGDEKKEIKQFATLSPIPGFWKNYLKPILEGDDRAFLLKTADIPSFFSKRQVSKILASTEVKSDRTEDLQGSLISILSDWDWVKNDSLRKQIQGPLTQITHHYISKEKNRHGKPLNPVAGFHLGNGATVTQKNVNFLGNPSERGLTESCGMMVNYIYTSSWLGKIKRSLRWFDKMEVKGMFSRRH